MSENHRRKKQPQLLRQQLLESAAQLAVEAGTEAVTLDAVAQRAGVSKGGLQYHFRSKQALLEALFDEWQEHFSVSLQAEMDADPIEVGRAARAYLRVATRDLDRTQETDAQLGIWRGLIVAMISDPTLRERYTVWAKAALQPDLTSGATMSDLLICRLAADGIWYSDLFDCYALTVEQRGEVIGRLEQMTYGMNGRKATP